MLIGQPTTSSRNGRRDAVTHALRVAVAELEPRSPIALSVKRLP